MPPKRKSAPSSTTIPTPKRISTRVRQRPSRPGDDRPNSPTPPVPTDPVALAEYVTSTLEANQRDVAGQLAEFEAALQTNTHQLNDITAFMNEIRQRMDSGMAQVRGDGPSSPVEPMTNPPGNIPTPAPHDILSRWPWVQRSLVENIANGEFDIYDLPKLHRDEYLRNRHIAKSVDSVVHPLSGGRPHIVHAKTKLQSSLRDFETLLSAWMVYVSIRTSYAPERSPGLALWTERVAFQVSLLYEFSTIVNYFVAYFQKHQNSVPEAWFSPDSDLHSDHFGNAAQRAVNSLRSSSVKPSIRPAATRQITPIPITDQVCHSWNRPTGCKIKEQTKKDCLRRHICGKCFVPEHKEFECTKTKSA